MFFFTQLPPRRMGCFGLSRRDISFTELRYCCLSCFTRVSSDTNGWDSGSCSHEWKAFLLTPENLSNFCQFLLCCCAHCHTQRHSGGSPNPHCGEAGRLQLGKEVKCLCVEFHPQVLGFKPMEMTAHMIL